MSREIETGLSYDDVLLVPKKSGVRSRRDISTETSLTQKISLRIPLVSANMDTVTESDMAIAMAMLGGIGIIHRFNTIEEQVREVRKVKRYSSAVIENPFIVNQKAEISDAQKIMHLNNVKSLLVVDNVNKLVGILTSRDLRFKTSDKHLICEVMTGKENLVVAEKGVSVGEAEKIMLKHRIEKLPIINPDYTIFGLITKKDIDRQKNFPFSSLDKKGRLRVGAAIGVKSDSLRRAGALVGAGADVLVVDVAHGHSELAINTLKAVKRDFPDVDVIAGNVCTPEGVRDLIEAGADAVKVGVGPGSICTTRIVTGSGYPQFSAVLNCSKEADKYNIPIIADGGIKNSGDIAKAIAAGASTVMIGNLLAGTEESPGMPVVRNGKKYKVYRGMASFGAELGRNSKENNKNNFSDAIDFVPEGVEAIVDYKGHVQEILNQLIRGLKSGISYSGHSSLKELRRGRGDFVKITQGGIRESRHHDVEVI